MTMLTTRDVPEELEKTYASYKNLSRKIFNRIQGAGEPKRISAHTDLFNLANGSSPLFITEGYFKLNSQDKTIRMYSELDFVIPENNYANYTLCSDFAADIVVFNRDAFSVCLQDAGLRDQWYHLLDLENKLNLALCAVYIGDDVDAGFKMKEYEAGTVITQEGDPPTEIFEMLTGSATVFLENQEVGQITSGEICGEISFLTESARTATVVASERCFVRVVEKEDFFLLIKASPHLAITISKTLAKRIIELNEKIVDPLA